MITLRICAVVFLVGCSQENDELKNFYDEDIQCPSPSVAEFTGWGKSGVQHICKIKHGTFIAWEGGYVHIRGQYEYGKETGIWSFYDSTGKLEKTINYSNAKP
ncbi:hypothetical protein [Methylomonas koyamae]|uniref:hypothetical protein n=1 Tax=Methylomonas koyamae TaxID=702114 RepID=UPI0012F6F8A8|nr:hypothetical protein [Methylomonas koyamae]BBL60356.1 hypothetical protein MKFW12EY_39690 [Methylomonas koyamae]